MIKHRQGKDGEEGTMKAPPRSQDSEGTPFEKFAQLFRAVASVPKEAVEKEEARERAKNQRKRAKKKAGRKASTTRP